MDAATVTSLVTQLDGLEARGRARLKLRADRRAASVALSAAAATAFVVATILLVLQFVRPVWPVVLVCVALLLPLATTAVVFLVARRGAWTRADALTVIDRRLALKDRATSSDEFLRMEMRDGFHGAALEEAGALIDRASMEVLPRIAIAPRPTRLQWAMFAGTLILLAAALMLARAQIAPQRAGPAGALMAAVESGEPSDGRRAIGGDGGDAVSAVGAQEGGGVDAGASAGSGSPASPQYQAGRKDDQAVAAGDREASSAAAAAASGTSPAQGAAGTGPSGAARREPGTRDAIGAGSRDADPSSASRASASTGNAASGDAPGNTPAERSRRPAPDMHDPQGGGQPPQPGTAPKTRSGAAAADIAPPKNESKPASPKSGGQQSGGGPQGAPGSGRSSSKDALKHTRGIGALMLAVPMEDRMIGATSPGSVRSMTRTAVTSGMPEADTVAAQARGEQNGDSGRVGHQPASRHDERLVRRYFARGGTVGDRRR